MTPDQYTNQELMLDVGDGHQLYVQDWGNKAAKTVIFFLHGGPGSGCDDGHKQYFDPLVQRVVFHDQRGCGKSLPYGSLENNTTTELVQDISAIADKLRIEKFIITGGSWGSCLAFAYALECPERVRGMVLRGIFTGSKSEIDWLDHGEFQNFFPDAWETYLATVPEEHRANPSSYHYNRVVGDDLQAARESGAAYLALELSAISLDDRHRPVSLVDFDPSGVRIEMHYMHNQCYLPDNYILDNAHRLTMPIHLIHGRYDMVCPPITAHTLHKRLPNSQLVWTISGHSAEHETWNAIRSALCQLT